MQCEVKYAFDRFCADNGADDPCVADLQKRINDAE